MCVTSSTDDLLFTFLQADGKMFPTTEKTLKVRKQVTAVKYGSEM